MPAELDKKKDERQRQVHHLPKETWTIGPLVDRA